MLFSPLSCKNLHPHHFDATFGELRKFGEPVLHIGHLVVGFKIGLIGEDFVEYEMARRFAIFLKEIDQILWIASDKRDAEFRLGQIEPAAVFWSVVPFEALD